MEKSTLFDTLVVVKRSGQRTTFQGEKIAIAIKKAFDSVEYPYQEEDVNKVYESVLKTILQEYMTRKTIQIEDIQDLIEQTLEKMGYQDVFHSFQNYREQRSASRKAFVTKQQHKFLKSIEALGLNTQEDEKKEEGPKERLLHYGTTIASGFAKAYLLETKILRAIDTGKIAIPHLESIALGNIENIELDVERLEKEGVQLYEKESSSKNIEEFLDFLVLLLKSVSTSVYGQILISNLDYAVTSYLLKTYQETLLQEMNSFLEYAGFKAFLSMDRIEKEIEKIESIDADLSTLSLLYPKTEMLQLGFRKVVFLSQKKTKLRCKKAISQFLKNLNSIYDKGMSFPIITIGLGTNETKEGRLFMETLLEVEKEDMRTVPSYMWKLKKNCNCKETDPNYDLTKSYLALSLISSKFRFTNLEMKANKNLYKKEDPTTEVCYFQDGGRVVDDTTTQDARVMGGKGNLFTCSINLPRLAFKAQEEKAKDAKIDVKTYFLDLLEQSLDLAKDALLSYFEALCNKHCYQFPLLLLQNIWQDGKNLKDIDRLRKVLKHGTLAIHFVGLEEALYSLTNQKRSQKETETLATKILHQMKEKVKSYSNLYNLNFTLSAKKVPEVCKHFNQVDTAIYGKHKGITEKEAYSNGFETGLSSWREVLAFEKNYHLFTNGGHLSCFPLSKSERHHIEEILQDIQKEEIGAFYFEEKH